MENLTGKTVILGITGGIAAYKMANVASGLKKAGADVHVIMTKHAAEFITPLTFETLTKNRCITDMFDRHFEYDVKHISLAKAADLILVAPATANVIAKLAHGIADDMLTTVVLAAKCRKLVSPAMNTAMLENPVTQDNIGILKHYGFDIIEPGVGLLACEDVGSGRLPEPEELLAEIEFRLAREKTLAGKTVTVTAGPTEEAIDPVRVITNHSTGTMGYALAKEAALRGAKVNLISGPVALDPVRHAEVIPVVSAAQMKEAVMQVIPETDIYISAAAVADYRPKTVAGEKIKKKDGDADLVLELARTDDILAGIAAYAEQAAKKPFICGFAMETEHLLENAAAKFAKKKMDLIVANSLRTPGAGFGTSTNGVTLYDGEEMTELPLMAKSEVAKCIFDVIEKKTGSM